MSEQENARDTLPGREPRSMRLVLDPPPLAPAFSAVRLGVSMGFARLARRPALLALLLAAALVVSGALIERAADPVSAAAAALRGTFRLVLPLLAFALVGEVTERGRLGDAAWPAARFGVARRDVALGLLGAAALVAAIAGAVLAVVSVALAHGPGDPPVVADAVKCAWIAALTSAAYVAWLGFAATFGKGGWRWKHWLPLVVDFVFGASGGVVGAILPHGNALNLLGGRAPLDMAQPTSSVLLVLMTVVMALLAALRAGD